MSKYDGNAYSASTWSIAVGPIGDFSDLLEEAANAAAGWISPLEPFHRSCDPFFNAVTIDFGGGRDVH